MEDERLNAALRTFLRRKSGQRPLIGGHRGASAYAPENTLAAFQAALATGAEMIELDVRVTKDGQLAVIHDDNTQRTAGVDLAIHTTSMARLRQIDVGSRLGPEWSGESIPELGDVLQLVRGKLAVNIEIKGGAEAVPIIARRSEEYEMRMDVIISSFDPVAVRGASQLSPPLLTGQLLDQPTLNPVGLAREVGASLVHMKHTLLDAILVQQLHSAGLGVVAWTVNDPDEMRRLAKLQVDAILSDDPRLLSAVLTEMQT